MFDFFNNITFANPLLLFLLLLLPILGFWYYYKYNERYPVMRMSTGQGVADVVSWRGRLQWLLPILRLLALGALIVAMARPQEVSKIIEEFSEGIDIVLVMDLSSSMLAQDFRPDRLEVSKRVATEFVEKRTWDRIGLVVFAGEAFTQCPLTSDHRVVKDFLSQLECGILEDGTAIGMGLATAVNRLKNTPGKSKVVILLTDGDNNAGYVKPITAAEIAREFDVKVYTIGVGTRGKALAPVSRRSNGEYIFGLATVQIDEALMRKIAEMTQGQYFRATSAEALQKIYADINLLETTETEVNSIKRESERFHIFALLGIIFLIFEFLLRYTVLRTIP